MALHLFGITHIVLAKVVFGDGVLGSHF